MLNKEQQDLVIRLVRETRSLIFREMENARVTVKGAADYVTNVDLAVQNHLKSQLETAFPEIRMIAEEKENQDLNADGSYWILDPIDGTTNLIHHYKMSAVALGLYEQGEITFGVVYNPFQEELYSAAKGEGAFLNGEPIHVSSVKALADAVVAYGSSPYEKEVYGEQLFQIFHDIFMNCADFRRSGSAALDLCHVAAGRLEAYFEQNLKPWDYSAGSVILTEAGGVLRPLKEDKIPYLANADILAAAPQFETALMQIIQNGLKD